MLPDLGHPAQTTGPADLGIDEYYTAAHKRRWRALDALADALCSRCCDATHTAPIHDYDPPRLRVRDTATGTHTAVVEVRPGLGRVDWYCWRDGHEITPADSPVSAAQMLAEELT